MQNLARKFKVTYFRFPVFDLDQILPIDAGWGRVQGARIRAQLSQTVQKLFKKNHFRNFAKIGFLRSEGHKFPKEVTKPQAGPPEAYPHSIWTSLPNLIKIVGSIFEQIAAGTTPQNGAENFQKILLPVCFVSRSWGSNAPRRPQRCTT